MTGNNCSLCPQRASEEEQEERKKEVYAAIKPHMHMIPNATLQRQLLKIDITLLKYELHTGRARTKYSLHSKKNPPKKPTQKTTAQKPGTVNRGIPLTAHTQERQISIFPTPIPISPFISPFP